MKGCIKRKFKVGQLIKVKNNTVFGPLIQVGDIGKITKIRKQENPFITFSCYDIYFDKYDLHQICDVKDALFYLSKINNKEE